MTDQLPTPPQASEASPLSDRSSAVQAIAESRRIATPEGIERLEQVAVGDGDRQWISIRGRHRANPVLLVVHGGPGTPTMPLAWAFQSPWEDFFTVVHWDQRGVGKNDATADRAALLATMTMDRIVADGEAVIDHLLLTLGKERVAVLGFSWEAIIGVQLARRCPGKISVYSGTGQAIATDFEAMILAETRAAAERASDAEAVRELSAFDLSLHPDGSPPIAAIQALRRIACRYHGMWYGRESLQVMIDLAALAPEYKAPSKALVTFERSSHFAMLEEPGRFLLALVQHVLPHTEGAPDFAPRLR